MSSTFFAGVGGVLSADIAVPDHERELRFYSRVLGTGEEPLWREDLMNNLGQPIIGLGARSEEYAQLPVVWMPHIQVADVASSAAHAVKLGGSELMHGKDDEGESQWAVLLDPNGAAFGIIPEVPASAIYPAEGVVPKSPPPEPGRITWVELCVPDAEATHLFYRQVLGVSSREVVMEHSGESYEDYHLLGNAGAAAAGICHARGVNLNLPPVWMISLPVGDYAMSLRHVQEEGGQVLLETRGGPGGSMRAVIEDPVGAHFAIVQG